jgi:hypothetical protein
LPSFPAAKPKNPLFRLHTLWHKARLFLPGRVPFCAAGRKPYMENIIASRQLQVERKHLTVDFCENPRGRFLRICEESHGRRNTVIVPSTGVAEFLQILNAVVPAADAAPTQPA